MKALKTTDNFLLFEANRIEYGIYDEPDVEKWAMFNENDEVTLYAIDNNYTVVDFDPADKPEDYVDGKYFFINGEFVLNSDWIAPPLPIEEQVAINTEDIAIVAQSAEESEEALCDLDEIYNSRLADIEDALCELAEMLSE